MKKIYSLCLIVFINFTTQAQIPDNVDISGSANGIVTMPTGLPSGYSTFVKYTKIQAPNGQAIHFMAQNLITDAQIIRARNILQFYLTNVPGSQYGANKTAVMNAMGTNNAELMLLNGSDGASTPPNIGAQTLYQNEIAVEGHAWYTGNDYTNHRDGSFEEILHLMHDKGIGIDTNGTPSATGALPAYQTEIRAAQVNAIANNFAIWPLGSVVGQGWYAELAAENSLSQEYLASVVDSYYGLWEAWNDAGTANSATTGMWGLYIAKTRAEEVTEDPMGYALMGKYFSPTININFDIDPTFTGIFNMTRTPSQPYTYKSQYLQDLTLTGTNASGIKGNDFVNKLNGNSANNTLEGGKGNDIIDGKAGTDKAIFTGNKADYTITGSGNAVTVTDNTANRDGTDTVTNCETLKFANQEIATSTLSVEDFELSKSLSMYPNPSADKISFELKNIDFNKISIAIFDVNGRKIKQKISNNNLIEIDTKPFTSGVYFVKIQRDNNNALVTKKLIIE